jgi:hypothetical protein
MTLGTVRLAIGVPAAAALIAVTAQPEPLARATNSPCMHVHAGITRYCGPATARLSVFPGILFSGGSCMNRISGGVHLLTIRIGAKSLVPGLTNDGLILFTLQLTGPLAHPTSGLVLAYSRWKYWQGRSVSFRGDARVGTFLAEAVFPSRGQASGSFRC